MSLLDRLVWSGNSMIRFESIWGASARDIIEITNCALWVMTLEALDERFGFNN